MTGDLTEVSGTIFAIDQTAIHDGPGVRMNVYLKGCPLHCLWCHSPESQAFKPELVWYETRCVNCGECLRVCPVEQQTPGRQVSDRNAECRACGACVDACPSGAREIKGRMVTAGEVAAEAARLKPFFSRTGGGVTLTGGEPAAQPAFAFAVASLCAEAGIHVAMETTGAVAWRDLQRLARVVDLFLYDVKLADDGLHRKYTGVPSKRILNNLGRLVEMGAQVVVRMPLIPGINDADDTVRETARAAHAHGARRITLLPFNPVTSGKYAWLSRPDPLPGAVRQSRSRLHRLEQCCRREGLEVVPA